MTMTAREKKAFHAFARGRVQGVGFRYSAIHEARRLGLFGTVKNCEDGSVEVIAEGDSDRLQRFVSWLRQGPHAAHVRELDVSDIPYCGTYKSFDVEF
jgi:acylphosphatase